MRTRRDVLRAGLLGVAGVGLASSRSFALPWTPPSGGFVQHVLPNGLRIHCISTHSAIVTAGLTLRSELILPEFGLAHLMEHTSFTGAAGGWPAAEVKAFRKRVIQDANASTWTEGIEWRVSFLPKYLADALGTLAMTSLDQRFDLETVASEARVVEQELLLDKHNAESATRAGTNAYLFGRDHPLAADTTAAELAVARRPAAELMPALQAFAARLRLPANMDLIIVGNVDAADVFTAAAASFGRFEAAGGPVLRLPRTTRSEQHRVIEGRSGELQHPLSKVQICWNCGITIEDADAAPMVMLGDVVGEMLETELRERKGEAYSPAAEYDPGICSGIVAMEVASSKSPKQIEQSVFSGLATIKARIEPDVLVRFQEQWDLDRLRMQESSSDTLDLFTARLIDGGSCYDLDVGSVTQDQVMAAADAHLPSKGGAYAKVVLRGT